MIIYKRQTNFGESMINDSTIKGTIPLITDTAMHTTKLCINFIYLSEMKLLIEALHCSIITRFDY